jgi:isoquinoline 1-oxidoreductase beta subunit
MIMLHAYLEDALRGTPRPDTFAMEKVSRRSVVAGLLATSGLVLSVDLMPAHARGPIAAYPTGAEAMDNKTVNNPKVFIAIARDGTVTIAAHRAEMGTGIKTSLPMVVAEELDADWSRVTIVPTVGDEIRYGNQDTDGSRSMRHFIQPMRQCGAAMRTMLEQAAAARWGVDVSLCRARNHQVVELNREGRATGRAAGFGDLAEAAMALPVPAVDTLLYKSPADYTLIGKGEVRITDLRDITTGKAIYGGDMRLPGMRYAVVARPPVLGGKVRSFDASDALKVPGVVAVHELAGVFAVPRVFGILGGIAVVGTSTHAAIKGRDALKIVWDHGPNAAYDSVAYDREMTETSKRPGTPIRKQGDVDKAFADARDTFVGEYHCEHIAQAPMEPPCAIARISGGKCEVWAPSQSPFAARNDVAKALGMTPDNVTLNMTLLGGGFGRKSQHDFVVEAALVSQKMGGTPILLQWTRDDDLHHGFYHTVSVERVEMALDARGKVTGWRHRSVAPSIISLFAPDKGDQFFIEHGMGLVNIPYDVANVSCETGKAMAMTRIGWYRSVSNIPRAFATGSAIAELAHKLGRDPKDVLVDLIGPDRTLDPKALGFPADFWHYGDPVETFPMETARLKHVIDVAAKAAGWGKTLPAGQGLGICAHLSWHTYVATIVHAAVDRDGTVRVPEVHTAIDCGVAINPERVRSQIEGAAVMGMSDTLYSGITFKGGAVEQSNFNDYPVARMSNYPRKVHVHIVNGKPSRPSGVGEPGLPPFHAALANAVFAATKKRIRTMPMGEKIA